MIKNVLIVCDAFPPQFAPRVGYLCKYIKEYNWEPFVLNGAREFSSHKKKDFSFLSETAKVESIHVSDTEQQAYLNAQKHSFLKIIKAFFLPDYNRPPLVNEKMFLKGCEILQKQHFDAILCFGSDVTPLGVAKRLSERFKIPWIADLRDIMEQNSKDAMPLRANIVRRRLILRRNYLLRKANAVVSVSPWHVDFLKKINPNTHLIYNGFDPEMFKLESPRVTSKFSICYTGTVIGLDRDVTSLFAALSHLLSDGVINQNKFRLFFYSDDMSHISIMKQAKNFRIEALIECKDYISASAIPDLLHQSSILLLLADKSTPNGPKGIMTTKFFEYLGSGRPILLTRSDEACLEQALIEARAGLAARTVDDVYNFIKSKYLEWQKNGYTVGTTAQSVIKKYSRKVQANQFALLLNSVIKM